MSLHTSELLEKRIKEFNIPKWPGQVSYDRILLYMLRYEDDAIVKGSSIIMPEEYSLKNKKTNRGIIVGAGPLALDVIRGNGMDLGHIVLSTRYGEWDQTVEEKLEDGKVNKTEFRICRDCDIAWSEDTMRMLDSGELILEKRDGKHQYALIGKPIERKDLSNEFAVNE